MQSLSADIWSILFKYLDAADIKALRLASVNSIAIKPAIDKGTTTFLNFINNKALIAGLRKCDMPDLIINFALKLGEGPFLQDHLQEITDKNTPKMQLNNLFIVAAGKGHLISMALMQRQGKVDLDARYQSDDVVGKTVVDNDFVPKVMKYSALKRTAFFGHLPCLRFLLDHGGNPLEDEIGERTILHIAVSSGHVDVVAFLVDSYPDLLGMTNKHQQLPLHLAAMHYDEKIFPLVLKHSVEHVNARAGGGHTTAHLLLIHPKKTDKTEVLKLLQQKGAKFDLLNEKGQTVESLRNTEVSQPYMTQLAK